MNYQVVRDWYRKAIGKQNTEQEEVTIAQAAKPKYVLVSFIEDQQFFLDQMNLAQEELYWLVRNANRVGTEAAKLYKQKNQLR